MASNMLKKERIRVKIMIFLILYPLEINKTLFLEGLNFTFRIWNSITHKVLFSSGSPVMKSILKLNQNGHPLIYLRKVSQTNIP